MDWIALASVLTTGTVAVVTVVSNALTKRGDRKHAAALDYEQRVWESKRAALVEVIGACEAIKAQIRQLLPGPGTKPDEATSLAHEGIGTDARRGPAASAG